MMVYLNNDFFYGFLVQSCDMSFGAFHRISSAISTLSREAVRIMLGFSAVVAMEVIHPP